MKSNKILIITSEFPPQPGGIGTHAYNLAKGLKKKGCLVEVICDIRSAIGEEEKVFDASLDFEVKRIIRKKIILFTYLKRIYTALKSTIKADVVICTGKFPLWLGAFLSFFFSRNFVAVVHGSELLLQKSLLRKLTNKSLEQFDLTIAVSRFTKSLLVDLSLKKIVVVNNGIDVSPNVSAKTKIPSKPVLLTVGNLTRRKGQHNVIKALPVLLNFFPGLEYYIVGIPTEKKKLQNLAVQLNVEKAVKFYGAVSEEEKFEIFKDADIFIMLSEATEEGDVEGFGIAILEANAMGLPTIGALGCGIEDAVKDEYSGFLVNINDAQEILYSILKILENYKQYSEKAREWSANFSWDLVVDQYIKYIFER